MDRNFLNHEVYVNASQGFTVKPGTLENYKENPDFKPSEHKPNTRGWHEAKYTKDGYSAGFFICSLASVDVECDKPGTFFAVRVTPFETEKEAFEYADNKFKLWCKEEERLQEIQTYLYKIGKGNNNAKNNPTPDAPQA